MRVLYVEDNPANVFLVKRVAKMGKHEIINYIDGGQALKKFDDINPDLILMDIQLAGDIGGLDVVRELRGRGVEVPIIAVTAYAMVGDKERCMEAGCNDYLAKPLPVPRLVEIFQEYSDQVESAKASATPVEEKSEANTETKDTDAPVAVSPNDDTTVVEESPKQETTTETVAAASTEEAKQETSTETETAIVETVAESEPKAVANSETVSDNQGVQEIKKPATGKLSDEKTEPVRAKTESEMPRSTSEPSSNS